MATKTKPEYYLLKVNNFNDIARDGLDEWIYFLKNEEIREDFSAGGLKKAKQELDILKLPETERAAYERYQDNLHYQASMFESSYVIGMENGMEKGEKNKAIEIAQNLIDVLDSDSLIDHRVLLLTYCLYVL